MNKTSVATVSLLAADGLLFLLVGFSSFYELAGFRTEILTGQPYEWPTYHRLTFTISLVCASAVLLCVGLYALHQMRSYGIVISVLVFVYGLWLLTAFPLLLQASVLFREQPDEYLVGPAVIALAALNYAVFRLKPPRVNA